MATCSRCGGDSFAPGAMISAVRTSFRPQDSKFLTLETGDVMTKAMMCRNCGVIEIVGDVSKLRRLTSEPDAKTERFATPAKTDGDAEKFPKAVNE
jgi:ribosomal protein S27AE